MATIQTTWECVLCLSNNSGDIVKPFLFTPTITRCECPSCASHFLIKFNLVNFGKVSYTFMEVKPSKKGAESFNLRRQLSLNDK